MEQTDRISAAILNQLPSSDVEGIGFNELLRKLGKRNLTNSPTTLSKRLRVLERDGLVRREVVRSNPPRIVKLYKDQNAVAAHEVSFQLGEQVKRTLEENRRLMADLATAPVSKLLESVVSITDSYPYVKGTLETSSLPELCESLWKLQRQLLELSAKIASITFAFLRMKKAIEEGRLSPVAVHQLLYEVQEKLKKPTKEDLDTQRD